MKILYWPIDPVLKKETSEHYRTRLAVNLKDREPLEIIRQITFDGVSPNIEIKDIENLFHFVERNFLKGRIRGIGLEVGAGPATFSSILAKRDSVEKMYAVEICEPIVELLKPKIVDYVLSGKKDKVIGAVGSFDDMELADESVDFIFDFFSLHHSDNLETTLKECSRILKKDGFIFCFDKARPNHFTREDLDGLLDVEYDENFKRQMGFAANLKITRRMNGEKEYRLKDWSEYFGDAGFKRIDYYLLDKISGSGFLSKLKKIISFMPVSLQKLLNNNLPKPKYNHKFIHESKNRIYSRLINPFRKEISLLIGHK